MFFTFSLEGVTSSIIIIIVRVVLPKLYSNKLNYKMNSDETIIGSNMF